jgi:hypothetical protein
MSVEEEKIAMELFLLARKARVFALITCAMLASGCQNGVHSPIAPSLTSAASPAESTSSVVMPGDEFTTQDAPVSYPINEVTAATGSSSGYSGTCTVSNSHTGSIRVKVDGQGLAYTLIVFNVVDLSDPLQLRTTEYVDVNQQGTFRTNWQSIAPGLFTVGGNLQCWLTSSVTGSTLASSNAFPAP